MHPRHTHHTHHIQRFANLARSNFWLFELSVWFHTLALSLISIFIPVLMYKAGYSISQIVLYFFLYNLCDVPLNFVAAWLTRRLGGRAVTALGTLAAIVFSLALFNLQTSGVALSNLLLLAVSAAIYDTLYWVAYIYLFMQSDTDGNHSGKNTGLLYAVRIAGTTIGPMLGAATLLLVGTSALIWMVIVLFLISLAPLALMDHPDDKPSVLRLSFREFFAPLRSRHIYLSKILYNLHDSVEGTLFPLFIFTIFGTFQSVAIIPVVASVAAIFTALLLGNIPRERRHAAIIGGAAVIAIAWIGRLLFPNPIFFYATVLVMGIFTQFILVPLDSEIFEYARESGDPLSASMYRNTSDMASNAILYGVLLLAMQVFKASFAIALIAILVLTIVNVFFRPSQAR